MNVSTGVECSGMSKTWSPFESNVYSEIPPTVFTALNPSTETGADPTSAAETLKATVETRAERNNARKIIKERSQKSELRVGVKAVRDSPQAWKVLQIREKIQRTRAQDADL